MTALTIDELCDKVQMAVAIKQQLEQSEIFKPAFYNDLKKQYDELIGQLKNYTLV